MADDTTVTITYTHTVPEEDVQKILEDYAQDEEIETEPHRIKEIVEEAVENDLKDWTTDSDVSPEIIIE